MKPTSRLTAPLADEWTRLLGEHRTLLADLLDTGQAKQRALVRFDGAEVASLTQREEALLERAEGFERRRRELAGRTAAALAEPAERLNVERIAARADAESGGALRAIRASLHEQGRALQRVNRLNRALTEQSLSHVQGFFRIFAGQEGADETYSRGGLERKPVGSTGVIDRVA